MRLIMAAVLTPQKAEVVLVKGMTRSLIHEVRSLPVQNKLPQKERNFDSCSAKVSEHLLLPAQRVWLLEAGVWYLSSKQLTLKLLTTILLDYPLIFLDESVCCGSQSHDTGTHFHRCRSPVISSISHVQDLIVRACWATQSPSWAQLFPVNGIFGGGMRCSKVPTPTASFPWPITRANLRSELRLQLIIQMSCHIQPLLGILNDLPGFGSLLPSENLGWDRPLLKVGIDDLHARATQFHREVSPFLGRL